MNTTRNGRTRNGRATLPTNVRVAIYTRKSNALGLEQDFNSIDAQREAVEHYIESQKGAGWIALLDRYDDGGFSGVSTKRPAFQRLIADVTAGKVDCIAVYRIDRLSRSFADYVAILKLLEEHEVTFVSVSEQFNTTTPTGRLVLNQLILFSQFEREVTAERIRDKMRATRRRGLWTGGRPILGYDAVDKKLIINEDEAPQVRDIFALYLECGSLRETIAELKRRGWINKSFDTKAGRRVDGHPFSNATLHALLTNVVYRGQQRCGDDVVAGVHEPLVAEGVWEAVQARLQSNGNPRGTEARNTTGAILRGLVTCGRCGSKMLHTITTKRSKLYRYYVCTKLHDKGAASCPDARVSAGKFEEFIAAQVRVIGDDPKLLAQTAESVAAAMVTKREQLNHERGRGEQERRRLEDERERLFQVMPATTLDAKPILDKVAKLDARLKTLEVRLADVRQELDAIGDDTVDVDTLREALSAFTPIWDQLFPREQERILRLLIEKVTYDPDGGDVEIDLRSSGIETLAEEAKETS